MPNIKSAKKRVIVTATKSAQNKMTKTAFKTEMKKFAADIAAADDKQAVVNAAYKAVDQACANGLLHKNNAARKKSAIARAAAQ
ncbi:MAG: 30S ribosomal protein S20 [Ruminococcaceae bacterium]|nr:30S ribosomal protein S20 [Oscillospiraceae bacterium]